MSIQALRNGSRNRKSKTLCDLINVRCAKTTSLGLGVRICGMQVWDAKNKGYIFQDKYCGRDLCTGTDFKNALTRYITSTAGGEPRVLTYHIPKIISKITQLGIQIFIFGLIRLAGIIRTMPQYRLYTTSLLFSYDGATQDEIDSLDEESGIKYSPDVCVKIIDFAHAITNLHTSDVINAPFPPSHPKNADRGYLKGLASLKHCFKMFFPAYLVLTIGSGKKFEGTKLCSRD